MQIINFFFFTKITFKKYCRAIKKKHNDHETMTNPTNDKNAIK